MVRRLCALGACLWLAACVTYTDRLKRGDELAAARQWTAAEEAYVSAQSSDPTRPEAALRIKAVRASHAQEFLAQGHLQRQNEQFAEAARLYQQALQLDPESTDVPAAMDATVESWLNKADVLLVDGRPGAALAAAEGVLKLRSGDLRARQLADKARAELARQFFSNAELYEKNGKLALALIEFAQAENTSPGGTPSGARLESVRKRLLDQLAYVVETNGAEDKSQSPDLAERMVAGRLGAALPEKLPIRILPKAPLGAYGIRLNFTLDKVLFTKEKTLIQKVQNYRLGTKSVANPKRPPLEEAFEKAEVAVRGSDRDVWEKVRLAGQVSDEVELARQMLERCYLEAIEKCQEDVEQCVANAGSQDPAACTLSEGCGTRACQGTQTAVKNKQLARDDAQTKLRAARQVLEDRREDLERARLALAKEPVTVDRPTYADFPYDAELHKAQVRVVTTVRIDDLSKPFPGSPVTVDFLTQHEDLTHRGYDKYDVREDPLELKTEQELRREAADRAVAEMIKRVRERFEVYRGQILDEARRLLARGGVTDDQVEVAVKAILVSPDKPPQDLLSALAKSRRLPNPALLFGR